MTQEVKKNDNFIAKKKSVFAGTDSWLQLCELAVSPTGDIIAIGNERRLVILAAKWDNSSSQSQFQIVSSGTIHESDSIRGIAILPIVSQAKSSRVCYMD